MSFSLERDKALPAIPVDVDTAGTLVEDEGFSSTPTGSATTAADTHKVLPSIHVENTLSGDDIGRLHELWNGAGLSARAHRRKGYGHNPALCRIPSPLFIPEPGHIRPTLMVPSAGPSTTSTSPPMTGTRKRWGFLSASHVSASQEVEKKTPNALEVLRTMAQDRLKKKLRYAKSAPNLGDQVTPLRRRVTAAKTTGTNGPRNSNLTRPHKSPTPERVLQQEDMDKDAIYFTIDPHWRASQGSVQFEFITPVPDSPTLSVRPDSPLLHRHSSLDRLSDTAQQATRSQTTIDALADLEARDKVLCAIDALHAYLEL